jgi:hypothetical protein
MGYASQSGRARTSARNPQAHAICDRCGFRYNHVNLRWQYDWRGASLMNIRLLVCNPCYDNPQEQLRAIVVPADPVPIVNPRIQDFVTAESNTRVTSGQNTIDPVTGLPVPAGNTRITENDDTRVTQPLGPPAGLDQDAIAPLQGSTHYGVLLPVNAITSNNTAIISVYCSSAHGLSTGDQISIEGISNGLVDGFYNATVVSPTVFSYEVAAPIAANSFYNPTVRVVTANVGVPYGF